MDYEIMMNGNVRIGQHAPDFEAQSTMGNISLSDYKGKWLFYFNPQEILPQVLQHKLLHLFIDDSGIVRLILIYPLNIGRCIPEILRCIEALQTSEKSKRFYSC